MLADEMRRSQPHEVRAARPGPAPGEPDPTAGTRAAHRLRRIRQVSARAVTEIDQALTDRTPWHRAH
ncbi:hypothetical protein [Nonomuraea sp. NPDC050783]|uniref:hypothetical protein n=1 Tax=Nonomuraea sp. NPDC050783 TaxID=3154634 RepID=UPI003466A4A4